MAPSQLDVARHDNVLCCPAQQALARAESLLEACSTGDIATVRVLIAAGVNVNAAVLYNQLPCAVAMSCIWVPVVGVHCSPLIYTTDALEVRFRF